MVNKGVYSLDVAQNLLFLHYNYCPYLYQSSMTRFSARLLTVSGSAYAAAISSLHKVLLLTVIGT